MASLKLVSSIIFLQMFLSLGFTPHGANGVDCLKVGYYEESCPQAEAITRKIIYEVLAVAPSLSGPLLRMFFHDCFVRGCDASVLLDSPMKQAEKDAPPNLTLRGYQIFDKVKTALEQVCPGVVSCADIITLAARDAVTAMGGSSWEVETGRRDGIISSTNEALANLPPPSLNINQLKVLFQQKGLTTKDLVVLSGAHTIGISHCSSITNRLYNFTGKGDGSSDPSLDSEYMVRLKMKCKEDNPKMIVEMDPGSFRTFDEHYYDLVAKRRGLFQTDAALLDDPETKAYVEIHSKDDFFFDFGVSMVNMGRIGVLTGNLGQIRNVCSKVNSLGLTT